MSEAEPQSPCISICVLDDDDVCTGCYRTAAEITDWFMASSAQKREILQLAIKRRDDSMPVRLL